MIKVIRAIKVMQATILTLILLKMMKTKVIV